MKWMIYCLLCLIAWGLWGFFPKLAQRSLTPFSAAVYQGVGTFALFAPLIPVFVIASRLNLSFMDQFKLNWHPTGVTYAVLAGIGAAVGGVLYQMALASSKGNVSMVVTITALYPVVTILLGWRVMGEQILLRQWAGIALALVAMVLVAQAPPEAPSAAGVAVGRHLPQTPAAMERGPTSPLPH